MKHCVFTVLLLAISYQLTVVSAQTYVWKNGYPLVEDPDSITFVEPDMRAQVVKMEKRTRSLPPFSCNSYIFHYPTKDYSGKPIWMSAELALTDEQVETKHIGRMAMFNHYTISRSDECPSATIGDLQGVAITYGYAVVSADHEGFGLTGDRNQAYCYGEANARASIDALLAARDWLAAQGYTLSDTIINYGYSQGGQTTVAAIKLSQTEYKGRVHFLKSFAGAGPYDLALTYKMFLKWEKIAQPIVLPMNVITTNELEFLNLDYKDIFQEPLASNVRSWIISKRFSTAELTPFIGHDSLKYVIQPAYLDSTSEEVQHVLQYVEKNNLTQGWTPDADTEVMLFHSLKDDIVPPENTAKMYEFFIENGASKATLTMDNYGGHLTAGQAFYLYMMQELTNLNK